jgi:hypothetical protein
VFPWQKKKLHACNACDGVGCTNCVHNGARVRRICVLKTDKIQCPKCEYTWTAEKKCSGCDSGCDACCDSGCSAPTCDGSWNSDGAVTLPPAFNSARAYLPAESERTDATLDPSLDMVKPVHATK